MHPRQDPASAGSSSIGLHSFDGDGDRASALMPIDASSASRKLQFGGVALPQGPLSGIETTKVSALRAEWNMLKRSFVIPFASRVEATPHWWRRRMGWDGDKGNERPLGGEGGNA